MSKFVVGAEVWVRDRYTEGKGRISKVSKVYKTGNFLVESEGNQQFRRYIGEDVACSTGDSWHHVYVDLYTEELKARHAKVKAEKEQKQVIIESVKNITNFFTWDNLRGARTDVDKDLIAALLDLGKKAEKETALLRFERAQEDAEWRNEQINKYLAIIERRKASGEVLNEFSYDVAELRRLKND